MIAEELDKILVEILGAKEDEIGDILDKNLDMVEKDVLDGTKLIVRDELDSIREVVRSAVEKESGYFDILSKLLKTL